MKELVDALYSRLLLRDIFAKIIPGSIILFAIGSSFGLCPDWHFIKELFTTEFTIWFWVLFFGASWIVSFAIQAFGRCTGLIRLYTCNLTENQHRDLRYAFDRWTSYRDREKQQLERYAVIMEACGNGYVAILLSALIMFLNKYVSSPSCSVPENSGDGVVVGTILWILLAVAHFAHVERHEHYLKSIVPEPALRSSVQERTCRICQILPNAWCCLKQWIQAHRLTLSTACEFKGSDPERSEEEED